MQQEKNNNDNSLDKPSDSTLLLKISHGEDMRRTRADINKEVSTFEELQRLLTSLWPDLKLNRIVIKYFDEDGDLISITSSNDWKEAIRSSSSSSLSKNQLSLVLVPSESFESIENFFEAMRHMPRHPHHPHPPFSPPPPQFYPESEQGGFGMMPPPPPPPHCPSHARGGGFPHHLHRGGSGGRGRGCLRGGGGRGGFNFPPPTRGMSSLFQHGGCRGGRGGSRGGGFHRHHPFLDPRGRFGPSHLHPPPPFFPDFEEQEKEHGDNENRGGPFVEQLAFLESMGFDDQESNIRALIDSHGDLQGAIASLVK